MKDKLAGTSKGCCRMWSKIEKWIATLEFDCDRKSMGVIVSSSSGRKSLLVKDYFLLYDSAILRSFVLFKAQVLYFGLVLAGGAQTISTTRSNPAEDARLPAVGGLGGLGLPEMFGSTQDTASLNQFMQNPAVSQMMQSLLFNPQYINQILGLNFQQSNMLGSNSQLREMMQNPEFFRQLTSPETMQIRLCIK
ncbi:Ubiquitin domain-containing protein DSK2b [Camellia lanceoleosa]|uniref:Ubiquitin domain-containing protein DSK2b n=1 Tax=Camellia lanceoleosa TaxID=1840588 RepID=A0ACC0HGI3_9ERIC|nr:Ubiquitin domain-containing protein DSK2b [Camellia lanceoleosa]